jgi:uncharacterized protein with HEPN domain
MNEATAKPQRQRPTLDDVLRTLEITGQATKHIPASVRQRYRVRHGPR